MKSFACCFLLSLWLPPVVHADTPATLTPQAPVELTGTQGRFDFIKVDSARHRLLASHTGNGSLDIIDLATSKLIKSGPTGNAQGVAIDDAGGRYFVSLSSPPQMVTVDAKTLAITGKVPLPDAADILAYRPQADRVYVCNDTKPELWVIDPAAQKIVTTLTMPGSGMEDVASNPQDQFLYQNLKDSNLLAQIDATSLKVVSTWPTAPAEKPHGLALVPELNSVLVVGGNGKLVLMSLTDGKVTASADVAPKVDEIAYDPGYARAY